MAFLNLLPPQATSCLRSGHSHHQLQHFTLLVIFLRKWEDWCQRLNFPQAEGLRAELCPVDAMADSTAGKSRARPSSQSTCLRPGPTSSGSYSLGSERKRAQLQRSLEGHFVPDGSCPGVPPWRSSLSVEVPALACARLKRWNGVPWSCALTPLVELYR